MVHVYCITKSQSKKEKKIDSSPRPHMCGGLSAHSNLSLLWIWPNLLFNDLSRILCYPYHYCVQYDWQHLSFYNFLSQHCLHAYWWVAKKGLTFLIVRHHGCEQCWLLYFSVLNNATVGFFRVSIELVRYRHLICYWMGILNYSSGINTNFDMVTSLRYGHLRM